MNDEQRKALWATITDPREALLQMIEHSDYIGSDPYFSDMNAALWEMAERAVAVSAPITTVLKPDPDHIARCKIAIHDYGTRKGATSAKVTSQLLKAGFTRDEISATTEEML